MLDRRVVYATMLCAGSAVVPTSVHAQDHTSDTAEVRASATARRSVRPDQARLTLQFTAEGGTPRQAGERLAARADTLRRSLAGLGISRDSLVTGSRWYWWPQRMEVVTRPRQVRAHTPRDGLWQALDTISTEDGGWYTVPRFDTTYRAREVIEVRLGDPTKVGPVIDAALALRITDISGIRFAASDTREAQLAAVREATARAFEQAEAMASASGGRLGRVLSLSTQPEYADRYGLDGFFQMRGVVATGSASATEITAPSVEITMTVCGRWQLLGR